MSKAKAEVHAEARSLRRQSNPPLSALSAPPREKKFGWQTKTFSEVLEIRNGRNQREVESADGEFPIYGSAGNVMGMAIDYICEAGTTIIGSKGNINSPIYAGTRFWNVDTAFGLAAKEAMDSRFLYFFCLSYDFSAHNRGTTIPSLVKSELLNIPIPVPPLPEQQRIVGLLDEAFEGLATAKANAEKNLQNARALFESHLQSVFTQRGPGWVEKSFEDCIEDVKYTTKIQRKEFLEAGEFPIVSQEAEFTNGYWDYAADVFKVTRPIVIFGDHTQVLKYIDFDFVLGADGVKLLPPKPFLNPKFFFYALRSAPRKSLGYARHYRLLKELQIGYPDTSTQVAIAKKLDALEVETQRLARIYEQKLAALAALKKSLLHQAFTGQL